MFEQSRVHLDGLVVPPVAQKPVELLQRRRIVLAVDQIGRGYRLPGMHIKEVYGAGVAVGRGGLGHRRRRGRQQCRQRSQDEGEIPGRISGCADAGALQQNVSLPFPMRRRPAARGAHLAASRRFTRATTHGAIPAVRSAESSEIRGWSAAIKPLVGNRVWPLAFPPTSTR